MEEREVAGIPLSRLEAPIQTALNQYQALADNGLVFQAEKASILEPTPTKPNSARSQTDAVYNGELAGKLFVIAFKPGDGTGSEEDRKLYDIVLYPKYPWAARSVPRNKTGVFAEVELAVLTHAIDNKHAEPNLYAGTFDLLTMSRNIVSKTHELGHPVGTVDPTPLTTFTVGYTLIEGRRFQRFADPHAVFSSVPDVLQVCAFLAMTNEVVSKHPSLLPSLNPQMPRKV